MAKLTLDDVGNLNTAGLATINENSSRIEAALENTLSRDGTAPNQMESDLDLNHNDIINVDNIDASVVQVDEFYIGGSKVYPTDLVVTNAVLRTDEDPTEFSFVSDDPDLSKDPDKLAPRSVIKNAFDTWDTFNLPVYINGDASNPDKELLRLQNLDWQPTATFAGVKTAGLQYLYVVRTGGAGTYGLNEILYEVAADKPDGAQDHASTVWINTRKVSGGRTNAFWPGANGPASNMAGHYLIAGPNSHVTSMEANVGNRWADFGLQEQYGGLGPFVGGISSAPDPIPSVEGQNYWPITNIDIGTGTVTVEGANWQANTGSTDGHNFTEWMGVIMSQNGGTFPNEIADGSIFYMRDVDQVAGTFKLAATYGGPALALTGSASGAIRCIPSYPAQYAFCALASRGHHQFYIGYLQPANTLRPDGVGALYRGTTLSEASARPQAAIKIRDWYSTGINFNLASFSGNQAIQMAAAHKITIGSSAGGAQAGGPVSGTGFEVVTLADASTINLKTTHGTGITIGDNGAATRMAFFGATPVVQPYHNTVTDTGFTAGSGTAVLVDSTFTGGVGTRAYHISDLVAALKNVGLLLA